MKYFSILILSFIFLACNQKHTTSSKISPTSNFDSFKKNHPLPIDFGIVIIDRKKSSNIIDTIHDEDCYKLLNESVLPVGNWNDSEKMKIVNITTRHIYEAIKKYDLSKDFTNEEVSNLLSISLDTVVKAFQPDKLNNTIAISVQDAFELFDTKSKDKAWGSFTKRYGLYGLHTFSTPIFNEDKTKGIFLLVSWGKDYFRKSLLVVKRLKTKWIVVKSIDIN